MSYILFYILLCFHIRIFFLSSIYLYIRLLFSKKNPIYQQFSSNKWMGREEKAYCSEIASLQIYKL